jgi:hypothetical protein
MPYRLRFIRPARKLKPTEVQAKIPMLQEPSAVSPHKRTWSWIPVRDPEIYPLLVCVATGFGMLAVYNVHNLMANPDINISKERRETPTTERYDPKQVQEFVKHRTRMATLRPNSVNTDEAFAPLRDAKTPYPSSAPGEAVWRGKEGTLDE